MSDVTIPEDPELESRVDRAMAVQGLRSGRKPTDSDRNWMREAIIAALDPDYDQFPNAPGLWAAIRSSHE